MAQQRADQVHHGAEPGVPTEDHTSSAPGHDRHEGHSPEMFRDRLWVSLLLTVPILYFSTQMQDWFGYDSVGFAADAWVSPVMASALFVYAGSVFLQGGRSELRDRAPGMMTLISIAISVAYGYSLAVSLGLSGSPFYWELATLLDVMLLGHWIEMRSVQSASRALEHLASMIPATAHLLGEGGQMEDVDVVDLREGDRILIRPGEQVPADGGVIEGQSSMNEAFLTGESRPVAKTIGSEVVAGALNAEGSLTVRLLRVGDSTTLSQVMRLVEDAQASRSGFQAIADRAAFWLTVVAVSVSIPTLVLWLVLGSSGATAAVARAVTVLVIACPHALGLAIPLVNMNATSIAARNGILVRNRESFERGHNIRRVAFDKTGTLTEGRFVISSVVAAEIAEDRALSLAAALERSSEHPLAAAIVEAAEQRGVAMVSSATGVTAVPGQGVEGTVDGRLIRVGHPQWIAELGLATPPALEDALTAADLRGESAVVVIDTGQPVAVLSMADRVRDSARAAIRSLRDLGIETTMITGDSEAVAMTVAESLGIAEYHARVQPREKALLIRDLASTAPTAFVGDGINDAPALLEADLGIALGAGTNVAIESADLVLIDNDPTDAVKVLILARRTRRKMIQNLAWATGYNVIALPLAAGVAAPLGIVLNPAAGALLMSLSTVVVALNAMLLRRVSLEIS